MIALFASAPLFFRPRFNFQGVGTALDDRGNAVSKADANQLELRMAALILGSVVQERGDRLIFVSSRLRARCLPPLGGDSHRGSPFAFGAGYGERRLRKRRRQQIDRRERPSRLILRASARNSSRMSTCDACSDAIASPFCVESVSSAVPTPRASARSASHSSGA